MFITISAAIVHLKLQLEYEYSSFLKLGHELRNTTTPPRSEPYARSAVRSSEVPTAGLLPNLRAIGFQARLVRRFLHPRLSGSHSTW